MKSKYSRSHWKQGDITVDGKVKRIYNNKKQLYVRPCLTRGDNICSQLVLKTNAFTS